MNGKNKTRIHDEQKALHRAAGVPSKQQAGCFRGLEARMACSCSTVWQAEHGVGQVGVGELSWGTGKLPIFSPWLAGGVGTVWMGDEGLTRRDDFLKTELAQRSIFKKIFVTGGIVSKYN